MACGARSGLKLNILRKSCVLDLWLNGLWSPFGIETGLSHYSGTCGRRGGSKPSLKPKKRKPLLQVCLQSRGRLLKGRNRQGLGQAQVQIVGVTTDGAMSAPGSAGQALDLAMSGQTTMF